MPAVAAAMLPLLMMAQPVPGKPPLIDKVVCEVMIRGVCKVEARAGDGGNGGNAVSNYYFYLGGPTAGNGGNGGNASGGMKPPPGASGPVRISPPPSPSATAAPPGPPVSLTLSRCRLVIGGKPEVQAKGCQYNKTGREFTVTAPSDNGKYVYTVRVALNEDKTGTGYLSGGKTNKVRELGQLVRKGACWAREDESLEICAWK